MLFSGEGGKRDLPLSLPSLIGVSGNRSIGLLVLSETSGYNLSSADAR